MSEYLMLFVLVFLVNILPAFGPPTWAVLVFVSFQTDLKPEMMVMVGAVGAATGRFALAHGFRAFARFLNEDSRRNLASARAAIEGRRKAMVAAIALFVFSPLPSAQLFEAAGLAGVRLAGFTFAFFAGRFFSYSLYVAGAVKLRETEFGATIKDALTDPVGIAIQLVLLAGLVALAKVDWSRFVRD